MPDITKFSRWLRSWTPKGIHEEAERSAEEIMQMYDEHRKQQEARVVAERLASGGLPPDFTVVAQSNPMTNHAMWILKQNGVTISTEPKATEDSYNTLRELAWLIYNNGIR